MKFKKILFTAALGGAMLLTACGGGNSGGGGGTKESYNLTVWVSEVDGLKELTEKQIQAFAKAEGVTIKATVEKQSESDSATAMIKDVTNGADLYCFAQDQLVRLVQASALAKLGGTAVNTVKEANDEDSIAAITFGSNYYAYPLTSDNGYFLYYDKTVVSEQDKGDFFKILKACEDADKLFSFETKTSGWYLASWFFGAGCVNEWTTSEDGSEFTGYTDTFDSDNGVLAARALSKFMQSKAHNSSSDGGDFSKGSAALVSGTWAYPTVKAALGDNMGVAELPSYTIDGHTFHLGSFKGCKLLGVKPQADAKKAAIASKLALFLTNKDSQLERFEAAGWGPSNKEAQTADAVKAAPHLQAVEAQRPYATTQGQIHGSWWGLATTLGTAIGDAKEDETAIRAALATYEAGLESLFSIDKTGYLVVGGHNDWDNADTSMVMTKVSDGVYEHTITMPDDADYKGFRIVHPTEWGKELGYAQCDEASQAVIDVEASSAAGNGDNNIILAKGGTYKITLTLSADKPINVAAVA